MADSRERRVEQFYREFKTQILASARRLDRECPEDLIQQTLEVWLRPKHNPQFTVMAFVRQMELLIYRDMHCTTRVKDGFASEERPQEIHGDIDRMWRQRHGRRTAPKATEDTSTPTMQVRSGDSTKRYRRHGRKTGRA